MCPKSKPEAILRIAVFSAKLKQDPNERAAAGVFGMQTEFRLLLPEIGRATEPDERLRGGVGP